MIKIFFVAFLLFGLARSQTAVRIGMFTTSDCKEESLVGLAYLNSNFDNVSLLLIYIFIIYMFLKTIGSLLFVVGNHRRAVHRYRRWPILQYRYWPGKPTSIRSSPRLVLLLSDWYSKRRQLRWFFHRRCDPFRRQVSGPKKFPITDWSVP